MVGPVSFSLTICGDRRDTRPAVRILLKQSAYMQVVDPLRSPVCDFCVSCYTFFLVKKTTK